MRKRILVIIGILLLIGLLFWLYRKYLYFPHAKVLPSMVDTVKWTNNSSVIEDTIRAGGPFTGGTYGAGYEYEVTRLPNRQFRFTVFKQGDPSNVRVDNIFSFDGALPEYLTK